MNKMLSIFLLSSFNFLAASEIHYALPDYRNIPLDHKIIERIGIRNGVFIEVGAYDGIVQSNTKLLEDLYGWTGVLVEPSKVLETQLINNRPNSKCFSCALGSFEQDNTYLYGNFEGTLMASISGDREHRPATQRTLVRSLQSILDEVNIQHINFFSLDVEGYELNVLKGIDFDKTRFDYLLIEVYAQFYQEIVDFLDIKGYSMVENFSNYSLATNPIWDGMHNDYLFQRK